MAKKGIDKEMRIKGKRQGVLPAMTSAGLALCGVFLLCTQEAVQAESSATPTVAVSDQAKAAEVIDRYCVSCHGPDKQKGGVRLDDFDLIDAVALQEVFINAREAVHFEEMPPAKSDQPSAAERKVLLDWLGERLSGDAAKKLEEKLQRPESGNYVNHVDLFSGEYADLKPFTYDRRWLISDYIFDEKFHRVFEDHEKTRVDGKMVEYAGTKAHPVNLTNPFAPDRPSGLRYYANQTLDSGQVQTMLANARMAADHMIILSGQKKDYLPAISGLLEQQLQLEAQLAERDQFLQTHIERLLKDVFKAEHEKLLPAFVPVERSEVDPGQDVKKAKFHAASPGRDELALIYLTLMKHKQRAGNDAEMLQAAERDWFYHGDSPAVIQRRLTFYENYKDEFWKNAADGKYGRYGVKPASYKPLSDSQMRSIADALREHRGPGDTYQAVIGKCLDQWRQEVQQQLADLGPAPEARVQALIAQLFGLIYEREPSPQESEKYTALADEFMSSLGRSEGVGRLIRTLLLNSEFVYRYEFGQGQADAHGRRMMSPRNASYAIAYALTDSSPDEALAKAAAEGRLNTREDYEREVKRLLAQRGRFTLIDHGVHGEQNAFNMTDLPIRELRFFREFFAYPKMMALFKDDKRFGGLYARSNARIVAEADRLVEHILEQDKDVFNQLLTTDSFYVFHSGDNEAMARAAERIRRIYDYFKDKNWQDYTYQELLKHKAFLDGVKMNNVRLDAKNKTSENKTLAAFKSDMKSFTTRYASGVAMAAPYSSAPGGRGDADTRGGVGMRMPEVVKCYNIDLADWEYPTTQPAPIKNRMGMLTHPAWLIAFSKNTETDPIHRGKWIRERLLADKVPDVPITVDAVVPEDPHKTLRQRMVEKTGDAYCWTCHQKMEPLGLPFEIFDDFGRFRTEESLEYPENLIKAVKSKGDPHEDLRDIYMTLPIESTGVLMGAGSSDLDGEVKDAFDLLDQLSKSDRVRQSIIRHAFRYFMGRNEMLSDSKTLIDADRAYLDGGGSFDAAIVSLLTSDSFIYRKEVTEED